MSSRHSRISRQEPRARKHSHSSLHLLDHLESRTLLAADPIGNVEVFTAGAISGWTRDADTPSQALTVRITVDGSPTDVLANTARPDLATVFGSGGKFAFSFTPTLTPGSHNVSVFALDSQSNTPVLLKSGTLVNNPPVGSADIVTPTRVAGWAFDPDAGATPISVRIDSNGATVTTVSANATRGDLASLGSTNHGFDVSGSFGVVDLWGIDSPSGTPVLLKSTNHASIGNVEVLTRSTVSGWVWDPDRGASAVTIRVKVDGVTAVETAANLERPDVASVTGGSTAHGFIANLSLSPGAHKVEVFAVESDTTSISETLLGTLGSVSNPPPIGSIDFATRGVVTGWAWDADAGASPLAMTIKVDGADAATATANESRPDIVSVTGSALHGYTANLSGLAVGPHRIDVFAADNPTNTQVKIATKVIDNTLPIGSLDVARPDVLAGWAYDQDPGSGALQVIVEMDGTRYPAATANVARPDLSVAAGFRENTHGFSIKTPTNLFGNHVVRIIALDTFDGTEQVIGTKNFVNNPPVGNIDFAGAIGVAGWTFDADNPAKSIDILVYIDGTLNTRVTAGLQRPDVASLTGGSTAHGFSTAFSGIVSSGRHTIEVFGIDPATGVTATLGQRSIVV